MLDFELALLVDLGRLVDRVRVTAPQRDDRFRPCGQARNRAADSHSVDAGQRKIQWQGVARVQFEGGRLSSVRRVRVVGGDVSHVWLDRRPVLGTFLCGHKALKVRQGTC